MATTVALNNCTITVTIRLQFRNASGLPDAQVRRLLERWRALAVTYLNGPAKARRWRCCRVVCEVETRYGGAPVAGYHQIEFRHDPRGRLGGSSVDRLAGNPPADIAGRFVDSELGSGFAHELGHLAGIDDGYHYDKATGAWVNDQGQPAGQPPSIMAQTWGAAQFLQRHIDESMVRLGATCPPECCPREDHHPPPPPPPPPPERPRAPDGIEALIRWATEGGPWRFAVASARLATAEARPHLMKALGAEGVLERWLAVSAFAELHRTAPDAATEEALTKGLRDRSHRVRLPAACALLKEKPGEAVPVLLKALLSDAPAIARPPARFCDIAADALEAQYGELAVPGDDDASARLDLFEAWSRRLAALGLG